MIGFYDYTTLLTYLSLLCYSWHLEIPPTCFIFLSIR